jgi:hypothetical protein
MKTKLGLVCVNSFVSYHAIHMVYDMYDAEFLLYLGEKFGKDID